MSMSKRKTIQSTRGNMKPAGKRYNLSNEPQTIMLLSLYSIIHNMETRIYRMLLLIKSFSHCHKRFYAT